ncbi:MAG: cadherin-like beta sandwich domain-containing protein, partial [Comamonadaceae bacterium]
AYSVNIGSPNFTLSPGALPGATVGVGYSQAMTAGGGTAPYTYSVLAGALPAGLSLSTAGVISGTPTTAGTFNFTVIARDSTTGPGAPYGVASSISLTVGAPVVAVSPATLPDGTVGTAYNQTVTASGGATPYTYAVTAGALPGGLGLDTGSGVVSGTPTATGTFSFTISATDANALIGTRAYAINIAAYANADLSALLTDSGVLTPGFSAGTTTYSVAVMNVVSTLAITPTVATAGATVTVNGVTVASGSASSPVALNVGANTITVAVTAPNGTTIKNYTLTVTRAGPQSIVDGASGMTLSIANSNPLCAFTASQFSHPASAVPAPSTAYTYLYNMAGFTATQCAVGSVLTVTITFPDPVPPGAVLLKFNPAATPAWQPFTPTISGNQVVYTIQDGGARDQDGAVNGQFVDPVVLALPVPVGAAGIPTLNEWSLLLLGVLAAGMGWWQLRRRVL